MQPWMLVTGAAGFIGSHLTAALLSRGVRVCGVDNFDPFYAQSRKRANIDSFDPNRFVLEEVDIRDTARMTEIMQRIKPRLVFHIAALAGVRPSIADPQRYVDVNVNGVASLFDAMRIAGVDRMVFASSSSVYGNNEKTPFAEEDPVLRQISPYAATKRAAEVLCEAYARVYGFRVALLRFFTVYGPGQRPDLAIGKFMKLIAMNESIPMFGDGSTSRDYTYIDDIINGVLNSSERLIDVEAGFNRIWNLGHSEPVSLREMIDAIALVVGRPAQIEQLPMQRGDVKRTFADISRAKAELDYNPEIAFEEGLRRQWEWMMPLLRRH